MAAIYLKQDASKPAVTAATLRELRDSQAHEGSVYLLMIRCLDSSYEFQTTADGVEIFSSGLQKVATVEVQGMIGNWLRTEWMESDRIYIQYLRRDVARAMEIVSSVDISKSQQEQALVWMAGSADAVARNGFSHGPTPDRRSLLQFLDEGDIVVGQNANMETVERWRFVDGKLQQIQQID